MRADEGEVSQGDVVRDNCDTDARRVRQSVPKSRRQYIVGQMARFVLNVVCAVAFARRYQAKR